VEHKTCRTDGYDMRHSIQFLPLKYVDLTYGRLACKADAYYCDVLSEINMLTTYMKFYMAAYPLAIFCK